jgi:Tfp pilus assembly protein FimV
MNKKSRLLLPLAVSLVSLQACSTAVQNSDDAQPAAMVETVTPVVVKAPAEAAPAPAPAAPSKAESAKTVALVDRYTVMPGDTLATIAAKREVYGNARMWQLLYRDNVQQIGPRGLIYPNQVLVVGRNHSPDEIKALGPRPKRAAPPVAPVAKRPVATHPVVKATATPLAKAPVAAPVAAAAAPAAAAAAPAVAAPAVVAPAVAAPAAVAPAPAAVVPAAAPVAATAPAVETKAVESQPVEAKTVAKKPATAPASGHAVKLADYLNGARAAFAAGDTPWAIYYYSVYLEQKNTDANAWGELGNVHHYDGDLGEAAKAFYNAANLMIDSGQTVRAVDLIPAIEEGDPGLAEALRQRLTTVKH